MQRVILVILAGYKQFISPLLPPSCRFHPTCSEYMMEAVRRYGPRHGVWLGLRRLARCHPFHPGGLDPVPAPGTPGIPERGLHASQSSDFGVRESAPRSAVSRIRLG
jgi:putative membrane protein insertion efficiency factor